MKNIIQHFGSKAELARLLDVDRAAVAQWCRFGLPPARAIEIETITNGKFKATDIVGAKDDGREDQDLPA